MDVLLESQLEALFFNFLTLDFVNTFFTWLTSIAATLSFWKIRTVSPHTPPTEPTASSSFNHQPYPTQEPLESHAGSSQLCPSIYDEEVDGITKGKFTMYLEEDCTFCEDDGEEEINRLDVNVVCDVKQVCTSWESCQLMFVRRCSGNLGWYRYQDFSAFNGRVVKLWEDERIHP